MLIIYKYGVAKMKTDSKNMINGFIPPPVYAPRQTGRSPAGRQAGFTIVEVVVASALLILSLAVFTVSFVQSRRSAAISDNRLDAIHTAREKMETLGSYLYTASELSVTPNPHTFYFSNGFYTVSNNTSAKVKDIVVTINWINPLGKITSTVSLAGSISSELHQ